MITFSDEELEEYFRLLDQADNYTRLAKTARYQADQYINKRIAIKRVEDMGK